MDKQQAAQKLMAMFGNVNAVAVLHSIVVGLSKYIIIILFAIYTWHCFTVFIGKNMDRKEEIYKRQKRIMFTIHFICSLVLFLNSLSVQIIGFYAAQVAFLVIVDKAYLYVYRNLSKLVMNNMLMLLTIGFLMIERLNRDFAVKQMIFAAIICFAGLFIPWMIERFSYFDRFGWIYAIIGIAFLALVFVIGQEHYGAKNWIGIGGFSLQPSEFVKIIFVFFVAAMFAKSTEFCDVVKVSAVAAVHVLILVAERDLGAALIYFITFVIVLYVSSQNPIYLLAAGAAGTVAAVVAWKLFTHVQVRVLAWRDPWSTIDNEGYQVARSLFGIGTGGWFGMGLGEGMPNSIPVASSDFIFSAICEEFGVFFGICLILVEVSCFVLFVNIALKMKRRFYKLTALGLAVEYIFQVFLTIGGVTKFIPSTGVTLPLVSYGGSSVISTVVLFCIIQGMYVLNFEEGSDAPTKQKGKRKDRSYEEYEPTQWEEEY
ncbi:MAG: FtsW/RodA/SpoVE family cell cycle protein [Lachnospiraceae bacterium]|nr:FtsW/RodA/SpoVE family cell cycle protein [Lachnospiraceae bacterium]